MMRMRMMSKVTTTVVSDLLLRNFVLFLLVGSSFDVVNADPFAPTGTAITAWYIIFNHPEHCIGGGSVGVDVGEGGDGGTDGTEGEGVVGQCGLRDIYGDDYLESVQQGTPNRLLIKSNEDVQISLLWAGGGVASSSISDENDDDTDDTRTSTIRLTSGLYRSSSNSIEDETTEIDGLVHPIYYFLSWEIEKGTNDGLPYGWKNTGSNAEIHLVIRTHGSTLYDNIHSTLQQTTNYMDQYCNDPFLGHVGQHYTIQHTNNTCQNIQYTILTSSNLHSIITGNNIDDDEDDNEIDNENNNKGRLELKLYNYETNQPIKDEGNDNDDDDDDTNWGHVIVKSMGQDGLQFIIETSVLDQSLKDIEVEEDDDDVYAMMKEKDEEFKLIMQEYPPYVANVWWIIFNHPEHCTSSSSSDSIGADATTTATNNSTTTTPPRTSRNSRSNPHCSLVDLLGTSYVESLLPTNNGISDPTLIFPNERVEIGMVWGGSGITDPMDYGNLKISSSLYRSSTSTSSSTLLLNQQVDPYGLGRGWTNPNAEIHLLIRNHGRIPAPLSNNNNNNTSSPSSYLEQMLNWNDPFCIDPTMNWIGTIFSENEEDTNKNNHNNVCYNSQIVQFVNMLQGTITTPMYHLDDDYGISSSERLVHRSSITLQSQGDSLLQAMIETPLGRWKDPSGDDHRDPIVVSTIPPASSSSSSSTITTARTFGKRSSIMFLGGISWMASWIIMM